MDTRTADREEEFWRTQYRSRDYVTYGGKVEDYLPAYRYGIDASLQFPDRTFAEMDATLERNWPRTRGRSSLKWAKAKLAAEDSWTRMKAAVAAAKEVAASTGESAASS
jgi:hypothetical protein